MTSRWLDGSRYQGIPNFPEVKASGIEGVVWNVDDPGFCDRIREAKAAGLRCAAYHFTQTGSGDPTAQAAHFHTLAAPVRSLLDFLAGDHESGSGDLTAWTHNYQLALAALDGHDPWFYSGGWWIRDHIFPGATQLRRWPLWDAAYQPTLPAAPAPWLSVAMWQHTSSATVPGISGNVDENYCYITEGVPNVDPQLKSALIRMCVYSVLGRQGIDQPSWDGWQAQFAATTDPDVLVAAFTDSAEAIAYRTALHNVAVPALQPHTHTLNGTTGAPA